MVWVTATRPKRQLSRTLKISLKTSQQVSGVGRLSALTALCRHWVSFSIMGSLSPCSLRVPIPWASLEPLECHIHATRYLSLATEPAPHPDFAGNPLISNDTESPYEFEVWEDPSGLDVRLARIRAL